MTKEELLEHVKNTWSPQEEFEYHGIQKSIENAMRHSQNSVYVNKTNLTQKVINKIKEDNFTIENCTKRGYTMCYVIRW